MQHLILLGTATKVGKTYSAMVLLNHLQQYGANPGFFKFAVNGAPSIEQSELATISRSCRLNQELSEMSPYFYPTTEDIYLASRNMRRLVNPSKVVEHFGWNIATHSHMVVEGVGSIISPLIMESNQVLFQDDLIRRLNLNIVLVVKAGSDAINHATLAVHYLNANNFEVKGFILNGFNPTKLSHRENYVMIERLCQLPVIGTIGVGSRSMSFHNNLNINYLFSSSNNNNNNNEIV